MQIIYKKVEELKPYENNPRINDEAVASVALSISEFGFKVPMVIDKDGIVVTGHTRLKAAIKLGLKEVPCIIADDLSDEQIKAFRIADNSTSQLAQWDLNKLSDELKEIDFDMEGLGLDEQLKDIENNFKNSKELKEDELPENVETRVKFGDIWQLGSHRLMCGDSTKEEDVNKLMNKTKANMVFTDPPYGMKKEKDGVKNDNLNYDDLLEFNKKWIPLTFKNLSNKGSWYCWGIDEPLMDIYSNILKPMIRNNEITFRNLITWDKGCGQGQMSEKCRMYATADEKCLFFMCGTQGFDNNSDNYFDGFEPIRSYLEKEINKIGIKSRKQIREICGVDMYNHWFTKSQFQLIPEKHYKELQEYAKGSDLSKEYSDLSKEYSDLSKEYDKIKEEFYSTRSYFDNTHDNMNSVWHFERTSRKEREEAGGHPTPKPIILCSRAIKSSSREGEIVLDVFGGSGSTLIACEQLNRICYMIELDPHFADVIIQRWENYTGKKANRLEK